jgi:hypothetical protein
MTATTTIDPDPVPDNFVAMARNPAEMAAAQTALMAWAMTKRAAAEADATELTANYEIARKNKWRSDLLKRHAARAVKRVEFWDKVHAALEAGYCIVPQLPVDVFAIRTTRVNPTKHLSNQEHISREQLSDIPALGDGHYVDSAPMVDTHTVEGFKDGKPVKVRQFWASDFAEVDFPVLAVKPQIMDATAAAMTAMIFDDLGILPERRGKGDPIIVGRIHYPGVKRYDSRNFKAINFLVAWWIDTKDL